MTDDEGEYTELRVTLPANDHDRLVRRSEEQELSDVETYAERVLSQVATKLRIRDRRQAGSDDAEVGEEAVRDRLRDLGYVD